MKSLIIIVFAFFTTAAMAQLSPLPTTSDSIALWNFDEESGEVLDSVNSPLNGETFSIIHEAVPGLGVEFGNAYKFTLPSSFIDLGIVPHTKIDFTGAEHFSIEALVYLTSAANSTHVIVDLENVKLEIINNQLAGVVRQPGGLLGVVSSVQLQQNTPYRVGLHFSTGVLIITINGISTAKVFLDNPISAPLFSNSRAYIGGNIFGQTLPGYIDDVRISGITGIDFTDPVVTLIQPDYQVNVPRPNFLITLSDDVSGVDPDSIQVYLNGNLQTGLTKTASQISGVMDDDLNGFILNEVRVLVSDFSGNIADKKFFFSFLSVIGRAEYQTDATTLALWHMNDFSPIETEDSSAYAHTGYSPARTTFTGDGVFSKGKMFNIAKGSVINFDGVRFDQQFTVEGWFQPSTNSSGEETLFFNGQVSIVRLNSGMIRASFHTIAQTLQYLSPTILLPVGELHHLAVTWDGNASGLNMRFYLDGIIVHTMNAPRNCDFDPAPRLSYLGLNYSGMMDEVRVSSNVRLGFNIPTLDNQVITFLTLKDGTGVMTAYPELHASMNSAETIDVSSVKIRLNSVLQPTGTSLLVTETTIDGTMADSAKEGLNVIEIEFLDNNGNYRKKSQYFIRTNQLGLSEYENDSTNATLWHFDADSMLTDSSVNSVNFPGTYNPIAGMIGNTHRGTVATPASINLSCRSFTVEGYFKKLFDNVGEASMFTMSGPTISSSFNVSENTGNIRLTMDYNAGGGMDQTFPAAFPMDSAFHHVAMVYDGSRSFGQLMIFIDGQMKSVIDFKSNCNATSNINFSMNGDYFNFDEVRISRKAIYAFNIMKPGTSLPTLVSTSHTDGQAVSTSPIDFSMTAEDTVGIDVSKTKLFLNGVEQTLTNQNKTRFSTVLGAQLQLTSGANVVKLKLINLSGNEIQKVLTLTLNGK